MRLYPRACVISLLEMAYLVFLQERIVHSQWEFYRRILGKAHSYLSSMRARSREPKWAVLQRLLEQIRLVLSKPTVRAVLRG